MDINHPLLIKSLDINVTAPPLPGTPCPCPSPGDPNLNKERVGHGRYVLCAPRLAAVPVDYLVYLEVF